jgi:hypothetical protein
MSNSALYAVTFLLIALTVALGYSFHREQQAANVVTSAVQAPGNVAR